MKSTNLRNNTERSSAIHRNELLTLGDLEDFKNSLLKEIENFIEGSKVQPLKRWLRSSEVRKMLGISTGTLQNFRINGTLPYTKVGGIVFYRYEDILEVMERNYNSKWGGG